MKKYLCVFYFLILSQQMFSEKTIICGYIENQVINQRINLVTFLHIIPDEEYSVIPEKDGAFKFEINIDQQRMFFLTYNGPNGIPVIVSNGDSIFVKFNASIQDPYREFLHQVSFSGSCKNINNALSSQVTKLYIYEDTVYRIYMKKYLNPFEFRDICIKKMKDQNTNLKIISKQYKLTREEKQYLILNNQFYWYNKLLVFGFSRPKQFSGNTNDYILYLDSLGYYKIMNNKKLFLNGLFSSSYYSLFIMNYFSYYYVANKELENKSNIERLNYLNENLKGETKEIITALYLYKYVSKSNKKEYNELIKKYLSSSNLINKLILL